MGTMKVVTGICDGWGIYQTKESHTHIGYGFLAYGVWLSSLGGQIPVKNKLDFLGQPWRER